MYLSYTDKESFGRYEKDWKILYQEQPAWIGALSRHKDAATSAL